MKQDDGVNSCHGRIRALVWIVEAQCFTTTWYRSCSPGVLVARHRPSKQYDSTDARTAPVSPSSSARNSASQRSYSYNMGRFRLRGSHIWLDGMGRLHNSNRLSNRTSHARGLCFPSCPRFTQPDRSALAKTVEGDENLVDNKNN